MPTRFSQKTIERLAPYVPQSTCNPSAKIGTRSLLALLERKYPGTGSDGISRACSSGGRSEHKEGRALDWDVNYTNLKQRAQAQAAITWLLKKDRMGRPYANARRLGVMYIIWNGKIWSSDKQQWNAYNGRSAHRDHMHISLSWAGALAKTSFWSGKVVNIPVPAPSVTPTAVPTVTPTATPTVPSGIEGNEGQAVSTPTATVSPTGSTSTVASSHDQKVPAWWWERE